jgi:hypothetical protein
MEGFMQDYRDTLYLDLQQIQDSLFDLKKLIEEDKKLLGRIKRKRIAKAEQKTELLEEVTRR